MLEIQQEGDGKKEGARADEEQGEEVEQGESEQNPLPGASRRRRIIEMYEDVHQRIEDLNRKLKDLKRQQKEIKETSDREVSMEKKQRKLAALAARVGETKRTLDRQNEERCLIEIHLSQYLGEGRRPRLLLLLDEPLKLMSTNTREKEEKEERKGEDTSDYDSQEVAEEEDGKRERKTKKDAKGRKAKEDKVGEAEESLFLSGVKNRRELPPWIKEK